MQEPTPTPDLALALIALERARTNLRAAHVDAQDVPAYLAGARAARADELAEKLADALAHTERLIFIVTGDCRADELGAQR
jgi:hypothetical protein